MLSRSSISPSPASIKSVLVSPLLGVALTSVPVLSAIVTLRAVLGHLEQFGVGSEEIFRGDRLPILPFPDRT